MWKRPPAVERPAQRHGTVLASDCWRLVFGSLHYGEDAAGHLRVPRIAAAHALIGVVKIDLPKDVVAFAANLEFKRAKAVIAMGVIVFGEDIKPLDALHDDGLCRKRQVSDAACQHDLTRH